MTRLAATLQTDVRVQWRNGFYLATAFVVVCSIALLRWLPNDITALLLPVVLLENILINTFYFVSALLLLERGEGTLSAQSITPLRGDVDLLACRRQPRDERPDLGVGLIHFGGCGEAFSCQLLPPAMIGARFLDPCHRDLERLVVGDRFGDQRIERRIAKVAPPVVLDVALAP